MGKETETAPDQQQEKTIDEQHADEIIEEKVLVKDSGKRNKKSEKGKTEKKRSKRTIQRILIDMSVVPVLLLGIILTVSTTRILQTNIEKELTESLDIAAHSVYNTYSLIAPGDYEMRDGRLYKGDVLLTGNYDIVDELKKTYKLDVTLFYGDTRVLTTVLDDSGRRIVGTTAGDDAVYWVLEHNREYFAKNIQIGKVKYYGYYIPVLSRDGEVVGMAFAGRPSRDVKVVIQSAVVKAVVISVIAILLTLLFCVTANRSITTALHAIQEYLSKLAGGQYDMSMPAAVKQRTDEIGDMGRNVIEVCGALEKKITTDPLTGLLNRRACNAQLDRMLSLVNRDETARLTVTIGDIDHFKNVNDTYGHECGDIVLKAVSEVFKEEMKERGFAARWGGEEFLLIFSAHVDDILDILNEIVWRIRSIKFEYEDYEPFSVTMTFGVNGRVLDKTNDEVIKEADHCLYEGKMTGRNRIVCTDGRVLLPDGSFSTVEEERRKTGETEDE